MAITDYTVVKDSNETIVDKFELYSYPATATGWQNLGVLSNNQTINVSKEIVEYKDGAAPWLYKAYTEQLKIEGALMQVGNAEALAFALGKDTIDTASDSDYKQIDFNKSVSVAPKMKMKFVGETVEGYAVEVLMLKGQNQNNDVSLAFGAGEVAEGAVSIVACYDSGSTESYDVGYIRIQQTT